MEHVSLSTQHLLLMNLTTREQLFIILNFPIRSIFFPLLRCSWFIHLMHWYDKLHLRVWRRNLNFVAAAAAADNAWFFVLSPLIARKLCIPDVSRRGGGAFLVISMMSLILKVECSPLRTSIFYILLALTEKLENWLSRYQRGHDETRKQQADMVGDAGFLRWGEWLSLFAV